MQLALPNREELVSRRAVFGPSQLLRDGAAEVRLRPGPDHEMPLARQLGAEGYQDYLGLPLREGARYLGLVSWATRRLQGFTPDDIGTLHEVHPVIHAMVLGRVHAEISSTLLRTYLGADAGERVRQGQVQRGDGQTLRAALWVSDLRDFTAMSERLPRDALLELLNASFGELVAAVHAQGGQVLKFIGDGMLATFLSGADDGRGACAAALRAALSARERINVLNEARRETGRTPVRFGLGLHFGDVMYGNIGGEDRLDFTVIGPAVNRAARLESLCRPLLRWLLLSRDFSERCGAPVQALGSFDLKGVADPFEVFGLPDTTDRVDADRG